MTDKLRFEKLTARHLPWFYDIRFSVEENILYGHQIQYLLRSNAIEDINQGGGWICRSGADYVGVGFGIFIPEALIGGLFVRPEYQQQGIGSILLERITGWLFSSGAESIHLTTDEASKAAAFYLSRGWLPDGKDEFGQLRMVKGKSK